MDMKDVNEKVTAHIPAINTPVVTDEQIINTVSQLDAAVADLLEAGRKQEETYQNKADLVKKARQLETEIQLVETDAVINIVGTGKDAYGMVTDSKGNAVKMPLNNDTQRDAYRRHFSADLRREQARVEAEIKAIEVAQFKAREDYDAKKQAVECIRAKASLQAAALTYLA